MIRFLSSNGYNLINGSTIEFETCSSGLASTETVFAVSDTELTIFDASTYDNNFGIFVYQNDEVLDMHNIELQNVNKYVQSGKFVYQVNLLFEPIEDRHHIGTVGFVTSDGNYEFVLSGKTSSIDEKLVVTLQNFKKFIDDDYVTAFRESVFNSASVDADLYNRKMREYLMNIHDISALNGSYKSLFAAIDFFGYGNLLELREYWVSNSINGSTIYKSTPIANAVLSYIDKSLAGFKKTNQMSLVYQISEQQGYDEDGLPIYRNVFSMADDILMKMRALQRVLEKDFLSFETHIVDIIGEFQSVVGIKMLMHLNTLRSDTFNQIEEDFTFSYVTKDIEIVNHKVIVKPWVLTASNPLKFVQTSSSAHNEDFFLIERKLDDFEEYDMLTKYLSSDFGLLEIKDLQINKQKYQFLQFSVFSNDQLIFSSESIDVNEFEDTILLGIRLTGTYRISFSLTDFYGGCKFFGVPEDLIVSYKELRVKLGVYADEGDYSVMEAWTTFKSSEGNNNVPSVISTTLNVNTWNPEINVPEMEIARKYASDYDMLSNYTTPNNLNSVQAKKMNSIPLISWADTYLVATINCYDYAYENNGFTYSDIYENVTISVESTSSRIETLMAIINAANESSLSEDFTFSIMPYSNDPEASFADTRYAIKMISKQPGFEKRLVNISSISGSSSTNMVPAFSNVDAFLQFGIVEEKTSDLVITLNSTEIIINDVTLSSTDDLLTIIQNDDRLSSLYSFEIESDNEKAIAIYSENDITIIHEALGIQYDVVRAKHLSRIYTIQSGSDIQLGKPVFACIDNARKTEVGDVNWTLIEALTNDQISTQNAYAFRYVFNRPGIYSLRCKFTHANKEYDMMINGFVIIV